ncbi:MAG: hypothetical protein ACTSR1_05335 [Candidatus Heimdallarchaeota archaeon]
MKNYTLYDATVEELRESANDFFKMGHYSPALTNFRAACETKLWETHFGLLVDMATNTPDIDYQVMQLCGRSYQALLTGKIKIAKEHLIKLLEFLPDNITILNFLGWCNLIDNQQEAINCFRKSIDSDANQPFVIELLALLYRDINDIPKFDVFLYLSIAHSPEAIRLWRTLILVYVEFDLQFDYDNHIIHNAETRKKLGLPEHKYSEKFGDIISKELTEVKANVAKDRKQRELQVQPKKTAIKERKTTKVKKQPAKETLSKEMYNYARVINFELNTMMRMSNMGRNFLAITSFVFLDVAIAFLILGNIYRDTDFWVKHLIFDICFIIILVVLPITTIIFSLKPKNTIKSKIPDILLLLLSIGATTTIITYSIILKTDYSEFLYLMLAFIPIVFVVFFIIWIITLLFIRGILVSNMQENVKSSFTIARRIISSFKNYRSMIRENPDEMLIVYVFYFLLLVNVGAPKGQNAEKNVTEMLNEAKKNDIHIEQLGDRLLYSFTMPGHVKKNIINGLFAILKAIPEIDNYNEDLSEAFDKANDILT